MRHLLSYEWASISKWYRYQPVDYIKDYFGVKIGLYFAWLGYYTYMLMLASIFGICCFLYSFFTMDQDKPSQDICSGDLDIKMCPLCDWCGYWDLKRTCFHVRVTYLFNNWTTVIFAVFMSFWGKLTSTVVRFHFTINWFFSNSFSRTLETIFCRNYSSMGFDWIRCTRGTSTSSILR